MAGGERDRRGGGRGGSRHAGAAGRDGKLPREVLVSKALSKLLRHGAEKEGLKLGPGGYVNVQDVLQARSIRPLKVTMPELSNLVASNEKQRFSLIPVSSAPSNSQQPATATEITTQTTQSVPSAPTATDDIASQLHETLTLKDTDNPSIYLIRANQGHSIKIADNQGLLTPITLEPSSTSEETSLPTCVVHGTTRRAWPLILASGGLKPMDRNHVHFATGLPAGFKQMQQTTSTPTASTSVTASSTGGDSVAVGGGSIDSHDAVRNEPVISGMRNSSSILIFLDLPKALARGLLFWRSANGVVLCDGGEDKLIPLEVFKSVEERGVKGGVLVTDGVVVKDMSSGRR